MQTSGNNLLKIAAVQHGDFVDAVRIIGEGRPEPYSGMADTLQHLEMLFADHPHCVVSLNSPAYRTERGAGLLIGLPPPQRLPLLPGTVTALRWARAICRELDAFAPTHVLLRTGGFLGWYILRHCVRRRLNVLVMLANTMGENPRGLERHINHWTVDLLNHPSVFLVGNHRPPAAQRLVECGVDARKVVAYDWPVKREPADWPEKRLPPADQHHLVYVGGIRLDKGVGDLLDAVLQLHHDGRRIRASFVGDGPELQELRQRVPTQWQDAIRFTGRISNDEAFATMREATLVCVPSWHAFSEGLPFTLTEALASRTPVVVSDHPVFRRGFREGEGVTFFPQRDVSRLAATIAATLDDATRYALLSVTTADAFERVRCRTTFGDVLTRWKQSFTQADATPDSHPQLSHP